MRLPRKIYNLINTIQLPSFLNISSYTSATASHKIILSPFSLSQIHLPYSHWSNFSITHIWSYYSPTLGSNILQWLPVTFRVSLNSVMAYRVLHGLDSAYFLNLIPFYFTLYNHNGYSRIYNLTFLKCAGVFSHPFAFESAIPFP